MKLVRDSVTFIASMVLIALLITTCSDITQAADDPPSDDFIKDGVSYRPLSKDTCEVTGTSLVKTSVLTIPETVEDGHGNTFKVTALQRYSIDSDDILELYLPATIETLSQAIYCHSIETLEIDSANPSYCSKNNNIYSKDESTLVLVNPAKTGTMNLEDTVTNISPDAFSSSNLSSVNNLPLLTVIPERLFMSCENLTEIQFRGCAAPNTIPEGTLMIGTNAFMGTKISELVLPESLRVIEYGAFSYSTLTTISLPENVYYIGESIFFGCKLLEKIQVHEENESYFSEDGVLFKKVTINKTEIISLEQYPANKPLENYVIPSNVSKVNSSAFSHTQNLKTVELCDALQVVDKYAFVICESLEKVILHDTTLIIDEGAFEGCVNLSEVIISKNLQSIMDYAFIGCECLSTLDFPESLEFIGDGAFISCGFKSLEFSENLKTVGDNAFQYNTDLTEVRFNGTTELGEKSFDTESELLTMTVPKSMNVDKSVFGDTPYEIQHIGDRPFPISNLFGIAVCLLILAGIVYLFRRI